MDDLTICKKIAEIEGIINPSCDGCYVYANVGDEDLPIWEIYNPLTDDALNHQLMIKYDVCRELTGGPAFRAVVCNWQGKPEYFRGTGDTLNKAILLAIIEAHESTKTKGI